MPDRWLNQEDLEHFIERECSVLEYCIDHPQETDTSEDLIYQEGFKKALAWLMNQFNGVYIRSRTDP